MIKVDEKQERRTHAKNIQALKVDPSMLIKV